MRKLLEDADGDGIPDIAEPGGVAAAADQTLEVEVVRSVFELGVKTYDSIDALPEEMRGPARAALEKASPKLAAAAAPAVSSKAKATTEAGEFAAPARAGRPRTAGPRPAGLSWVIVLATALGAALVYLLMRR